MFVKALGKNATDETETTLIMCHALSIIAIANDPTDCVYRGQHGWLQMIVSRNVELGSERSTQTIELKREITASKRTESAS